MQNKVLNYRIIIEPEKMGRRIVYNAYCSTLGLADYGYSIDEAVSNIRSLIKFHIESLLEDHQEVPTENTDQEIPFVETWEKFKSLDYMKLLSDGGHPNAEGHNLIFETVKEAVS